MKRQGGSQLISESLVQRIGVENVRLGTPVQKIVQRDDGNEIHSLLSVHYLRHCRLGTVLVITNRDATEFRCRRVILAIPPSQIGTNESVEFGCRVLSLCFIQFPSNSNRCYQDTNVKC